MTKQVTLPTETILNMQEVHYHDSFQAIVIDPQNKLSPQMAVKAFFTTAPAWVEGLMTVRDKIMGALGFKTSGTTEERKAILAQFEGKAGEELGLFNVFGSNENEIIIGENDRHLDFRISTLVLPETATTKTLTLTTTVVFNNWMGRLYFLPVKPFHKLIVPVMLKRMVKALEEQLK